jgi:hypothetical protein
MDPSEVEKAVFAKCLAPLSSNGIALPDRTIYVRTSSSVLASGVTDSAGTANIIIPQQTAGTRLVATLMSIPALTPVCSLISSRSPLISH